MEIAAFLHILPSFLFEISSKSIGVGMVDIFCDHTIVNQATDTCMNIVKGDINFTEINNII